MVSVREAHLESGASACWQWLSLPGSTWALALALKPWWGPLLCLQGALRRSLPLALSPMWHLVAVASAFRHHLLRLCPDI